MNAPGARTAELAGIEIGVGQVRVDLLTGHGVTSVALPLDAASHQALPAVLALHAHGRSCPGRADVHVGLLLRATAVLGCRSPHLVVRPHADPPVVLRFPGADAAEVTLGTLDVCCLLCSCRLPITLETAA